MKAGLASVTRPCHTAAVPVVVRQEDWFAQWECASNHHDAAVAAADVPAALAVTAKGNRSTLSASLGGLDVDIYQAFMDEGVVAAVQVAVRLMVECVGIDGGRAALYYSLMIPVGFAMNALGQLMGVGKFLFWWQPLTCYGLYVIPVTMGLRHLALHDQYLWGLWFMSLLELGGYALETSVAFPGNIIDVVLGPRNYALFMAVFFSAFVPLFNTVVSRIVQRWPFDTYAPFPPDRGDTSNVVRLGVTLTY